MYHRFRACQELDIEPRTEVRRFADLLDEKTFVVECNLKRRHLNEMQRAEMGYVLEDIEREKAAKNQEATIPPKGEKGFQPVLESNDANTDPVTGKIDYCKTKASARVAKKVGLSTKTYERAKQIIEKAPEELKEKVRKGETSISYAYKQVKRAKSLHSKIAEKKCKTGLNYDVENSLRR